jgi:hypothetical protein
MEKCFVPSDVFSAIENNRFLSVYGEVVELFIRPHYCAAKGVCLPTGDFFDFASGVHRCTALANFLNLHHPGIGPTLRTECLMHKKGYRYAVPDIITYQPPLRTEYYEIKPNSSSGIDGGRYKLKVFDIVCSSYRLPYVRGTQYSPNARLLVWDGTWLGSPAKVYLTWKLAEPGLLVYELCIEVSQQTLEEMMAKALIKLVVLAGILLLKNPGFSIGAGAAAARLLLTSVGSTLQGPVGPNSTNNPKDVRYVQAMLNDWRGRKALPLIGMTGTFNNETRQAIIDFQREVTSQVDGRIDVNGAGIRALEEAHVVSNLVISMPAASTLGVVALTTDFGYDFHGSLEVPEEPVVSEEQADPNLNLDRMAESGLRDYLNDLYT